MRDLVTSEHPPTGAGAGFGGQDITYEAPVALDAYTAALTEIAALKTRVRALEQHAELVRARALEAGVPMADVRAAERAHAGARRVPVDPELFERTAPRWNCVAYPGEGMHYPIGADGSCGWCGLSREAREAERRST